MSARPGPAEPTPEQCSVQARVEIDGPRVAYAIWYPQMGGYVSKAVIVFHPGDVRSDSTACFEAYVWHDGEFPFEEESSGRAPAVIHHCNPAQFVHFGEAVQGLMRGAR